MVSLASGLVEFDHGFCVPTPCHSGGGGFAPGVFSVVNGLDALCCCDLEIGLTFGDIEFCFSFSVFPPGRVAYLLVMVSRTSLLWKVKGIFL